MDLDMHMHVHTATERDNLYLEKKSSKMIMNFSFFLLVGHRCHTARNITLYQDEDVKYPL